MESDLIRLVVIILLLATSALFSATEIAVLALGRHRAGRMPPGRAGVWLEKLLARPAATLGAILVTITVMNYTTEAIAASTAVARLGLPVWTAMVAIAALVIVLVEVVPITYAAANTERVARVAAGPLWAASKVLSLPARSIGYTAERLAGLLGGRPRPAVPVTEGEIRAIVDLQAEAGGLEEEEKAMIHQIFEFGEKTAGEVMVPRPDMVAIAHTGTAKEAGRLATEHRVSRLPVYRASLDDIEGVVYVKDVLPLLAAGKADVGVESVMRPVFRVPETKKLSELLTDFRRRQRTLAMVVDEYGGTAGLVTVEDLLEEVVGDIYDEYDVVRPMVRRLGRGATILDGRMSVSEASRAVGVALPEGEYDSIAGLVYQHLGAVPEAGRRVDLPGVSLIVERVEGNRISRVRAVRRPESEGEGRDASGGEATPRA